MAAKGVVWQVSEVVAVRKRVVSLAMALLLTPFAIPVVQAAAAPFPDVPASFWAANAIDALAAQGILRGEPDGLFHPLRPVTRGQFAAMIVRAEQLPTVSVGPHFTDVPTSSALYGDIETAAAGGLMLGTSLQEFTPSATIDRAMAAAITVRAVGLAVVGTDLAALQPSYADAAKIPSYARGNVVVAKRLGLMQGLAGNVFDPTGQLSRAQAAAVIYRMLGLTPSAIAGVAAPLVSRISAGSGQSSIAVGQSTQLWSVPRDASGEPLPAQVQWAASGGALSGTSFSSETPGTYRLTASVPQAGVQAAVTVHVEQAVSLAIYGLPEVVGPGAKVPLQVTVLDQTGSRDRADGSRTVTLTATNPDAQPVTLTATATNGQAGFTFVPPAAGAWSLAASSPGVTNAAAAFDVLAAPFTSPLALAGPAQILPGRTATVRASLPSGASESSPVTLTSSNPAVLAVQGSGSGSLTAAGASFGVRAVAPGTATLNLVNGPGAYTAASLQVTVPALGQLSVSPPPATSAGATAQARVTVASNGTAAAPPTVSLTLTNPQGVQVQTESAAAQNGGASFGLQRDEAGTWHLTASAPGYTSATAAWVVNPGAATQLIATGAPSTIVVVGGSSDLQVMLADRFDNPLAAPLSVSLTAQGGAGSLSQTSANLGGPGAAARFQAAAPGTETVRVTDPAAPSLGAVQVTFRVIAQAADVAAGKGFWLLGSDLSQQPVPQLLAELKKLGATHVYLEVEGSWGFYGSSELRTFLYQAHDAGIAVLAWVYPYLKNVPLDERLTGQVAAYVAPTGDRPDGIAADIEENTHAPAVGSYAAFVRKALGPAGVFIAVTYPPIYHEDYPFATLAPYVTLYAPMDYWHYQATPEDFSQAYQYVNQTVVLIRQLAGLPEVPVSVIGQTYDMFSNGAQGVFSPTPQELQAAFQAASDSGALGISFYRLPTATPAELQTIRTLPYPYPSR